MLTFSDQSDSESIKKTIQSLHKEVVASYPITPLFDKGIKNKTCVDLGSNIGIFTAYAAAYFEKVWAFEASETTFALSNRFLKANNVSNANVYNLAVWSKSEETLKVVKPSYASTTESKDASVVYQAKDEEFELVKTISLADIFKLANVDYIDYLKVDIEGAEYETLLNHDLSNIGVIVGEIHSHPTMPFDGENGSRSLLLNHVKKKFDILWEAPNNFICISKEIKKP